jgi:hypothetical protein
VYTTAPFSPLRDSGGQIIGFAPGSGDFNTDGDNFDFPDVSSYNMSTSRQAYLHGAVSPANFPAPALGTQGNEKVGQFRNPGFAEFNAALFKEVPIIGERLKLQLRAEGFNLLNRVNLQGVDPNLANGTFGRSTSQLEPRWFQFGARVIF